MPSSDTTLVRTCDRRKMASAGSSRAARAVDRTPLPISRDARERSERHPAGRIVGTVALPSLSAGWGFVFLHAPQRVCQFAVSVRPVSDWPVPLSRRCQTTVRGGGLAVRPVRLPRAWLLYACTDEGQCNNLYTNLDGYADTEMITQGGCWGDTNSSGPMLWRFTLIWNLDGGGGGSDDDDGSGGPA